MNSLGTIYIFHVTRRNNVVPKTTLPVTMLTIPPGSLSLGVEYIIYTLFLLLLIMIVKLKGWK